MTRCSSATVIETDRFYKVRKKKKRRGREKNKRKKGDLYRKSMAVLARC
jgi:hypothetical protein